MRMIEQKICALTAILLAAASFDWGIGRAAAGDFCVRLTRAELDQSRLRRGDAQGCSTGSAASDAAKTNAFNAIQFECTNRITLQTVAHACTRAGLIVNTSAVGLWGAFPPPGRPAADGVKYIGHGIGSAASANLCIDANIVSFQTRRVPDGNCGGSPPLKQIDTVHVRARCGVICNTP